MADRPGSARPPGQRAAPSRTLGVHLVAGWPVGDRVVDPPTDRSGDVLALARIQL